MSSLDKDRLISALESKLLSVLQMLFPDGNQRGHQYVVGDVYGAAGDSLKIELRPRDGKPAGIWRDFATDEGGDLLSLWAMRRGFNLPTQFKEVLEDISQWLGESVGDHSSRVKPKHNNDAKTDQIKTGKPTDQWNYLDEDGQLLARVYRYDSPQGKEFRLWDARTNKWRAPSPRPLFNLPGIKGADSVVLVEGEKCAQTLIAEGITATTAMNGANAPVDKTDWSPLKDKAVLIWPDNDAPGKTYAELVAHTLFETGVRSVQVLIIGKQHPPKWDAADAKAENICLKSFIEQSRKRNLMRDRMILDLDDWTASRYQGEPPTQKYLVEDLIPLGVVGLLAAMGDTGKGVLLLHLALQVATGKPMRGIIGPEPKAFGKQVIETGTAVIFSAEDDCSEIHRRIDRLDPHNYRNEQPERLMVIPLPDVGGPFPIVVDTPQGLVLTQKYREIQEALLQIDDLKLIVFDPLASFVRAEANADPSVASFAMSTLSLLALETGATVIVAHHMRKARGSRSSDFAEQARNAIRGTTAIVDGVRFAYALLPAPNHIQAEAFRVMRTSPSSNAVFLGAIVKSNAPAERVVRIFSRTDTGLLADITDRFDPKGTKNDAYMLDELVNAIHLAVESGHPITKTGINGVYENRHRLSHPLNKISKHRLEDMVQTLLEKKRLVRCRISKSASAMWLDTPDGPLARGEATFAIGAPQEVSHD